MTQPGKAPELDASNPGAAGAALARRLLASIKATVERTNKSAGEFNKAQAAGGQAASTAMLDAVMNLGGGGVIPMVKGMIVPAERMLQFTDYNKAKRALAAGADPEYTFLSSGAYNSPDAKDGVLRSVISDLNAALKPAAADAHRGKLPKDATLGDILDHQELFAKFPELKYIPVAAEWNNHNGASYYPRSSKEKLGAMGFGTASDPASFLSNVLHETQHAVQNYGGMSPGGNPGQFIADPDRLKKGVTAASNKLNDTIDVLMAKYGQDGLNDNWAKQRGTPERANMVAARKEFLTLFNLNQKAAASYMDIPGEREARLVQEMYNRKLGTDAFPPALLSGIKSLQSQRGLNTEQYHDLTTQVQDLLNTLVPRVNNKP